MEINKATVEGLVVLRNEDTFPSDKVLKDALGMRNLYKCIPNEILNFTLSTFDQ